MLRIRRRELSVTHPNRLRRRAVWCLIAPMVEDRPSQTAAFVALWRALGDCLPSEVRLCHDPLGWSFAPPLTARLQPLARRFPRMVGRLLLASPLRRLVLWIQLRTRAIDDLVAAFVRDGGTQLVVLGAGFDSRAVRLTPGLPGLAVFEVDHPATQARKREILAARSVDANASFVAWDFEHSSLARLPATLKERGLDPTHPTLTIWEGVIPYLTEAAVAATLAAVRELGSERSRVVLHYIEHRRIHARTIWHTIASRVGEPLRFGWDPGALPEWLATRSFCLLSDEGDDELARRYFPARWRSRFRGAGGRIALAQPG
jgi:methyltransferase (TIGR00027 family)